LTATFFIPTFYTMLNFKTFIFNPFQVNTYVIHDTETSEGIIVDPGNSRNKENRNLSSFIETNDISITKVVITHGHIDHVFGVNYTSENFTTDIYFPSPDYPLLEHLEKQSEMVGMTINKIEKPKFDLHTFEELILGNYKIDIRKVPGHSPGGTILVFHSERKLLTGDTIFFESVGRSDLYGGDFQELKNSISSQILSLPDDYEILPGHGPLTTVGHEKQHNPFL